MNYTITDLPELQKNVLVFDNLLSDSESQYIQSYFENYLDWGLRETKNNTSGVTEQEIKEAKIEDVYEYTQFSTSILSNKNAPMKQVLRSWNVQQNHLMPSLIPLFKVCNKQRMIVDLDSIIRIKANIQTKVSRKFKDKYNLPHIDCENETKNYTLIYYINDSDGDSYFFNERVIARSKEEFIKQVKNLTVYKKVTPKRGRLVLFRSDILHAGSHPIQNDFRMVINYNFYPHPNREILDI